MTKVAKDTHCHLLDMPDELLLKIVRYALKSDAYSVEHAFKDYKHLLESVNELTAPLRVHTKLYGIGLQEVMKVNVFPVKALPDKCLRFDEEGVQVSPVDEWMWCSSPSLLAKLRHVDLHLRLTDVYGWRDHAPDDPVAQTTDWAIEWAHSMPALLPNVQTLSLHLDAHPDGVEVVDYDSASSFECKITNGVTMVIEALEESGIPLISVSCLGWNNLSSRIDMSMSETIKVASTLVEGIEGDAIFLL